MNLAIVGYGKMGKLIERLAPEFGFTVTVKLDIENNKDGEGITQALFQDVDAAIEFSTPDTVVKNVAKLTALGIPTVVGTTGWTEHLVQVRILVAKSDAGLVWSPNFSIGVAVFRRVVAEAAKLLQDESSYGAWAWEIHHDQKKDAPSGTLLHLVQTMRDNGFNRPIDVGSNRAGSHPGTHEIGFDSAADTITLRHTARSREGFARGALKAAQWVPGKKGFYTFEEVLFGNEPVQ